MAEASITTLPAKGSAATGNGMLMPLFSGGQLDFSNITVDDINLIDIIEALSKLNRYRGHTYFPYTVAQHCCMVADLVAEEDDEPEAILYALLHDGAEAYMIDIPEPIKRMLKDKGVWDVFEKLEEDLDRAIFAKVGLEYPMPANIAKLVKAADLRLVATELVDVMPPVPPGQWWNLKPSVKRADMEIAPLDYEEVKLAFTSQLNTAWNRLYRKQVAKSNVRPLN